VTSIPFTAQLRSRPGELRLGTEGEPVITLRVQVPEVWDTVRLAAPADTPVAVIKSRALEVLLPDEPHHEGFVVKLGGWEVLDESASLADAGVQHGAILLVTSRRRRPVR
jgi:hypothetical protein